MWEEWIHTITPTKIQKQSLWAQFLVDYNLFSSMYLPPDLLRKAKNSIQVSRLVNQPRNNSQHLELEENDELNPDSYFIQPYLISLFTTSSCPTCLWGMQFS